MHFLLLITTQGHREGTIQHARLGKRDLILQLAVPEFNVFFKDLSMAHQTIERQGEKGGEKRW
jgi:hypothetical protein